MVPAVVSGIRLAAGVTLLLEGAPRAISAADLVAIEAAARPLLDELRRRGLQPEIPGAARGAWPIEPIEPTDPSESTAPTESTEPAPPTSPGRQST